MGITPALTAELTSATVRKIAVVKLILLMLFIVLIFFLVLAFRDSSLVPPSSRTRGLRRAREKSFQAFTCVHHAFTKEKNRERFRKNGFATLNG
jgi:hypothetical protein